MPTPVLGIDIAKLKFDVALLVDGKYRHKVFANNATGFVDLLHWLDGLSATEVHACMEATGSYGEALAEFLFENGILVSVVNPAQVKAFGGSQLQRNKTDKADAKLIATFCFHLRPSGWQPLPPEIRSLQAMVKRLESLQEMRQQEVNRLDTAATFVRDDIAEHISYLDKTIAELKSRIRKHIDQDPGLKGKAELLASIPGIGEATIAQVLAFIPCAERFASARQLAAWVGLNPRLQQSGSSIQRRTVLAKTGNAGLRKALYMPALVAMRYNAAMVAFAARLKLAGKPGKSIVCAVMRKLVHIIYGVLKHRTPFNAELALAS